MGLGRKVWVANDILAAADVNGYLMDQSVMYFASSTARSNAIGTPSIGMVSSIGGTALDMYTGTAWTGVYPAVVSSLSGTAVQFGGTAITASMTATSALENGTIYVSGTAAVTVTIPDVLQVWDSITIWRNGGGTVTIAAGTGVTDWAGAGTAGTAVTFKIDQTYSAAGVQKVAANTYRVVGKITAG